MSRGFPELLSMRKMPYEGTEPEAHGGSRNFLLGKTSLLSEETSPRDSDDGGVMRAVRSLPMTGSRRPCRLLDADGILESRNLSTPAPDFSELYKRRNSTGGGGLLPQSMFGGLGEKESTLPGETQQDEKESQDRRRRNLTELQTRCLLEEGDESDSTEDKGSSSDEDDESPASGGWAPRARFHRRPRRRSLSKQKEAAAAKREPVPQRRGSTGSALLDMEKLRRSSRSGELLPMMSKEPEVTKKTVKRGAMTKAKLLLGDVSSDDADDDDGSSDGCSDVEGYKWNGLPDPAIVKRGPKPETSELMKRRAFFMARTKGLVVYPPKRDGPSEGRVNRTVNPLFARRGSCPAHL